MIEESANARHDERDQSDPRQSKGQEVSGFRVLCLAALAALGGCSSRVADMPVGSAAIDAAPRDIVAAAPMENYRIGLLDELRVTVFREPDLSVETAVVDVSGKIDLPLLGQVPVLGRTTNEVSADLSRALNARYLRDAQVSVAVTKPVSYSFTIEGEVKSPGTYQIPGEITLLRAVAIGQGVTERARLSEVVVFRNVAGHSYVARFDLQDVRAGRMPDPQLRAGDIVVVNYSAGQQLYRDFLQIIPGLAGIFVALAN